MFQTILYSYPFCLGIALPNQLLDTLDLVTTIPQRGPRAPTCFMFFTLRKTKTHGLIENHMFSSMIFQFAPTYFSHGFPIITSLVVSTPLREKKSVGVSIPIGKLKHVPNSYGPYKSTVLIKRFYIYIYTTLVMGVSSSHL